MYLTKTPAFIQSLFPDIIWKVPDTEQKLYLTFDDGPIPEVTEWVLDMLLQYKAKATFFCVGENIEKHPTIFNRIKIEGHSVGNHTYHHKNGWQTNSDQYFKDIDRCDQLVGNKLFRPPYGKLTFKQLKFLKKEYKIVMWDILSGDFDQNLDAENCYSRIIQKTSDGSILVFHDSIKAQRILTHVLPRVLDHFSKLGFTFEPIPSM